MALPFDIANFNLVNFANAYNDIFDSTSKDVSIQQKDNDGNISTKTVANRGKFKQQIWDDVGGALGQFDRSFYVDDVDGDDDNDGSSSNSFKTIKKACDSIPVGGRGIIYIKGSDDEDNPVVYTDIDILCTSKYIQLYPRDDTYSVIQPSVTSNDNYNYCQGFLLYNTTLLVYTLHGRLKVKSSPKNNTDIGWSWHHAGVINTYGGNNSIFFGSYPSADGITCDEGESNIINVCIRNTYVTHTSVTFSHIHLIQENASQDNKIIHNYNSAGTISLNVYGTDIKDHDDNSIGWNDIIDGIVKDADSGNPINVLSNINFSD